MQLHRDAATLPSQGRALDCHRPLLLAAELPTGYGYWRPWRRAPETRRQLHPHCLWIAVTSPALPVSVRSKSTLSPTLAASLIAGDRKSVELGKSVSVRVDLGGRRIIKYIT